MLLSIIINGKNIVIATGSEVAVPDNVAIDEKDILSWSLKLFVLRISFFSKRENYAFISCSNSYKNFYEILYPQ